MPQSSWNRSVLNIKVNKTKYFQYFIEICSIKSHWNTHLLRSISSPFALPKISFFTLHCLSAIPSETLATLLKRQKRQHVLLKKKKASLEFLKNKERKTQAHFFSSYSFSPSLTTSLKKRKKRRERDPNLYDSPLIWSDF